MTIDVFRDLRNQSKIGVRFVDGKVRRVTYAELMDSALHFADGLFRKGVHTGEPVVLVMTNPQSAVIAILGCLFAGCPPAPVYPPQSANAVPGFLRFVKHVADRSQSSLIVADSQPHTFLGNVPHQAASVRGVYKFEAVMSETIAMDFSADCTNPIAFLQFTSGSTSTPKGVLVTHEGLMANLQMIRKASRMDEKSSVVTWLPVYHDMGLIGTVLNAITLPCELVVLPPMMFLKKPRMWLELISEFRGTHTAAPNFAYGLCVKRIANPHGLDLSTMTTFICGAEPVLPKTMQAFVDHFAAAGLRSGALVPAYGLAEATLAVTFSPYMRGLAVDQMEFPVASCGFPLEGVRLRIASNEEKELGERQIGEIQIKGPTVTPGYIGDEKATGESRTPDGWLRTGDLGYIANGELYPCGRKKDLIIIRGRNFHAHDLESLTSEVPDVRTGNVVAFGIAGESGESLVIVAETRSEAEGTDRKVRSHLAESLGVTPDDVVIVPAGTLPKTSSGKLKRSETRRLYEENRLHAKTGKLAVLQAAVQSGLGFLRKKS